MSDFQQRGTITTLPRLVDLNESERQIELDRYSVRTPPALLIPCLASEMDQPALGHIVRELALVRYLHTIVISLDRASESDYERALAYFRGTGQRTVVMWNDSEKLRTIAREIESQTVSLGPVEGVENVHFAVNSRIEPDGMGASFQGKEIGRRVASTSEPRTQRFPAE